jgi:uncharacterized protein
MSGLVIDAFEFCRHKERRDGQFAIADLPRLAAEAVDHTGSIRWGLTGDIDKNGHLRLVLSVSGAVRVICQRCLTPFAFEVVSASTMVLAKDDDAADEMEAMLDNDAIDVIVGSKTMDVAALIEDEALLALPQSPRHEACPGAVVPDAADAVKKASPFDVLKNLK